MLKSIKSEQGLYLIAMFTAITLQTSLAFTTWINKWATQNMYYILRGTRDEKESSKRLLQRFPFTLKEIKFNDYLSRRSFLNGKKEVILPVMFI